MKLKLSDYRRYAIPVIERVIKMRPERQPIDIIGDLAIATNCHIILVAHYLGELHGKTVQLTNLIVRLMEFYKIDEVVE
jgi:hypothetical protein